MKISMWMIAEKLEKYQPRCSILDGTACITGVRFVSKDGKTPFLPQYVYMSVDRNLQPLRKEKDKAVLINGRDIITLWGQDADEILNDLLAVFDFYNSWERALWEASTRKSIQQIIDLGDTVLENPAMVVDMTGNVLAMSSTYVDEDINDNWKESRQSRRISAAELGAPMYKEDGTLGAWSETPEILALPDGVKIIATFLKVDGEVVAGFCLWGHNRPISPSDVELVKLLIGALTSCLEVQKAETPTVSVAIVLRDMLDGVQYNDDIMERLTLEGGQTWRLLVVCSPYRSDELYKQNLVEKLQLLDSSCVPVIYHDYVVALISDNNAEMIVNSVLGEKEQKYYLAVLSLPFKNFPDVTVRYSQAQYVIDLVKKTTGIYRMEDYGAQYLLKLLCECSEKQEMIHPALEILKEHDAQRNSELYETLFQYLLNERSILVGAQAMHIHKNSLMYRLQRIKAVANLDLDDPATRIYLLLSYMMDKANKQE